MTIRSSNKAFCSDVIKTRRKIFFFEMSGEINGPSQKDKSGNAQDFIVWYCVFYPQLAK